MTTRPDEDDVYRLTAGEPLADSVRAVATSQLDKALASIDEDDRHEAVHDVRKRCKKVRALVRLVRDDVPGTYDDVNTRLRDAARLISDARDAAAAVETHDALGDALGGDAIAPYQPVREQLRQRRDGDVADEVEERLPAVRERLAAVRDEVASWELPDGDGVDVLAAGYARTYGRARDRWERAVEDASTHHWHQWRKRVKYHRHQVDLLREAWLPVMLQREDLLHELTDLLGDDHDLAELRELLVAGDELDLDRELVTGYVGLLDARRARLQHETLPDASRLFAAGVDEHVALTLGWWRRAVEDAHARVEAVTDRAPHTPIIPVGA